MRGEDRIEERIGGGAERVVSNVCVFQATHDTDMMSDIHKIGKEKKKQTNEDEVRNRSDLM